MLRTLAVLVPCLVATATFAQASVTDPVQQDPGTDGFPDGDAGDNWSTPTPIQVGGQSFEEYGMLVPLDDPGDYFVVYLQAHGIPGFLSVTASPIALDIRLAVLDPRGEVHLAEPGAFGEAETVHIDYAMPGPYVIGVVDAMCDGAALPCATGAGAAVPLSTVAGNYQLAMSCDPFC